MLKKNTVFRTGIVSIMWIMMCNTVIAETPKSKTPWRVVNQSLGELLDSGWKIISYSSNRVVIAPYTNGAVDEERYSYILQKNGKFINCFVDSPRPDNAYSSCRQLN
jgi:hypothetical protein